LISSKEHLELCRKTEAEIFFQLPNCFPDDYSEYIDLFSENSALTPWFPSVLIGKDYNTAVEILQKVAPKQIVTDNTGIAYEAYKKGIDWIAGPYLNSVNSFTLLCLKEQFNCSGAFISNELNNYQIKKMTPPENFKLYYSIYHPILLMTCRHCLHHQIEGCDKNIVDEECTLQCNRSASITNMKNVPLLIEKTKGCYHRIFNNHNFLNTAIVTDLPNRFSSFLVDLTAVKTETDVAMDNISLIQSFEKLLNGDPEAKQEIENSIQPTTNSQYKKGI
jgi:putative protease